MTEEIKYQRVETFEIDLKPGLITLKRDKDGWSLTLWEGNDVYEGQAVVKLAPSQLEAIGEMFTDAWLRQVNG